MLSHDSGNFRSASSYIINAQDLIYNVNPSNPIILELRRRPIWRNLQISAQRCSHVLIVEIPIEFQFTSL